MTRPKLLDLFCGAGGAAMGDAVTVNVLQWIGERMVKVHGRG